MFGCVSGESIRIRVLIFCVGALLQRVGTKGLHVHVEMDPARARIELATVVATWLSFLPQALKRQANARGSCVRCLLKVTVLWPSVACAQGAVKREEDATRVNLTRGGIDGAACVGEVLHASFLEGRIEIGDVNTCA
jgi:hypothetical protein